MIHDTYLVVQQQLCIVVSIEQYTTVAEQLSKKEASVSRGTTLYSECQKSVKSQRLRTFFKLIVSFFQKYAYYFLV